MFADSAHNTEWTRQASGPYSNLLLQCVCLSVYWFEKQSHNITLAAYCRGVRHSNPNTVCGVAALLLYCDPLAMSQPASWKSRAIASGRRHLSHLLVRYRRKFNYALTVTQNGEMTCDRIGARGLHFQLVCVCVCIGDAVGYFRNHIRNRFSYLLMCLKHTAHKVAKYADLCWNNMNERSTERTNACEDETLVECKCAPSNRRYTIGRVDRIFVLEAYLHISKPISYTPKIASLRCVVVIVSDNADERNIHLLNICGIYMLHIFISYVGRCRNACTICVDASKRGTYNIMRVLIGIITFNMESAAG